MKCKCPPTSPFHWATEKRESIFVNDIAFRAKGADGKSAAQIAADVIERRREVDPSLGTIKNIGTAANRHKEEERMLAFRQFGVYSRAKPSIRHPNKHEK